jgi:hypothetical protein
LAALVGNLQIYRNRRICCEQKYIHELEKAKRKLIIDDRNNVHSSYVVILQPGMGNNLLFVAPYEPRVNTFGETF